MKRTTLLILLIGIVAGVQLTSALADSRRDQYNVNAAGLGMKGYDPVSYHEGDPHKGLESISLIHNTIRYNFASQDSRHRFATDPSRYEPAYGGWCAWAMLEGDKVDINPKRYKIINGKTYLFYDRFFVDTLSKWNRLANTESEFSMIKRADAQWNRLTKWP